MHGEYVSTCAMISLLASEPSKTIHWITGTPFTCSSCFKPYQFGTVAADMYNRAPDSLWVLHKKVETRGKLEELEDKLRELDNEALMCGLKLISGEPGEAFGKFCEKERVIAEGLSQ